MNQMRRNHMKRRVVTEVALPIADVIRVWRGNGMAWPTIRTYVCWVKRFRDWLRCQHGGALTAQLNETVVIRWAGNVARKRSIASKHAKHAACCALRAWSWGLRACNFEVPEWRIRSGESRPLSTLLNAYAEHRLNIRGVAESTLQHELSEVEQFLTFLRRRRHAIADLQVADIDLYLAMRSRCLARKTLARVVSVLRAFLRFLYSSSHIYHDLALVIDGPKIRQNECPPRALPWVDVRKILNGINKSSRKGRRDFALLLMMAVYGLGAAEVRGLTLDSIDWRRKLLKVVRVKTSREISLPLLPAVAHALSAYLQHGRPRYCATRTLFVRMRTPHIEIGSTTTIAHVLRQAAFSAGISAPFLGSHALRHSHASRQIDLGTSAKVVGDILGHKRPETTSRYVRVALSRLRPLSLPVPQ